MAPELSGTALEQYLREVLGPETELVAVRELEGGVLRPASDVKGFGYGHPLEVELRRRGVLQRFVLGQTREETGFGHEHFADRAQGLLWNHAAFNRLPRHARSCDVGFLTRSGALRSAGDAVEFVQLVEKVEGRQYRVDLERLLATGALTGLDRARALALADYLVEIHGVRQDAPHLYDRRLRELVGHGECIMGVVDSYPRPYPLLPDGTLERIEQACLAWRWRLKAHADRLCQVHGDYHPWNILFRDGTDFSLLDRSRGEWGEAADDVSCLAINYLFFALQREGRLGGPFEVLFRLFYDRYVEKTGDGALGLVIAPFFAFRGLVLASPLWYPRLPDAVRQALFRFIEHVLAVEAFEPEAVNRYLEG